MRQLVAIAALFAVSLLAAAADFTGRVVSIHDGDTLTVETAGQLERVRLLDIDAPELQQPFGISARGMLRALCPNESLARVSWQKRDADRRVLGRVTCGGVDVNAELVRHGSAWVFSKYAPRASPLYALEEQARKDRIGLWYSGNAVPPWEWRRRKRAGITT